MYYTRWYFDEIFRIIGQIIYYSSFVFLIPLILSIILKEQTLFIGNYALSFLIVFLFGLILYKFIPKNNFVELSGIHYLLIVCGLWLIFCTVSTIPYYVFGYSFIDSFFDTMSLLTTTGTTTLPYIIDLTSFHVWRAILSWIGGIGIVLIAFYGLLNTNIFFSKKIAMAEGHDQMTNSYKGTIKALWIIYIVLTIIGIILLLLVGMDLLNSVTYTMSAISTTGHDMPNANYIYNGNIQLVIAFIILLGATSFVTHYKVYKEKNPLVYFKDPQFIFISVIIFIFFLIFYAYLHTTQTWQSILGLIVGSMGGGFIVFSPEMILGLAPLLFLLLLFVMFVGGAKGSTAGGITQERFLLLIKSIFWQIKEIRLPDLSTISKKYDDRIIDDDEIKLLYFFVASYLFFIVFGVLVLTAYGYPLNTSIFEVISTQGNIGIPIGIAEYSMPLIPKIVLILNMWVGRLEIIPIFGLIGMLFQRTRVI
ncbi:MAG TPA: potassium transporter TrkG [archaeon]|nr:potassium transporter TrkG [archaeon]